MNVIPGTIDDVPIDTLVLHPRNARRGDIGAIHTSIQETGFYGRVLVQRSTMHVLAGNHRLQAAQHAGATHVPAEIIDVDDDTALRILLADNRTNDLADYDDAKLAELLRDLVTNTGTLDGTGYDGDDLDDLENLLAGPPDLDDLANTRDNTTHDTASTVTVTMTVQPTTATAWREHVKAYTDDDEALTALLE